MTATNALLTTDGDLTSPPCARDNQLAGLAAAIGKALPANDNRQAIRGGRWVVEMEDRPIYSTYASRTLGYPPTFWPADNYPDVVAFTGVASSGKSTAAQFLVDKLGYTRVRFAGPLKDMMRAIGLEEEQIEAGDKESPAGRLLGKTPRYAMQTLGTEWGRNCIGEDFWVHLWRYRVIPVLDAGGRVVVDDCRFPNEAAAIRKLGGDIFKIEGRGGIAGSHVSEAGVGIADVVLSNLGTIDELHGKVVEALERYG